MTTYEADQQALAEQIEKANFEAANQAGAREVFAAFPQIMPNEANMNMLASYCAPGPITLLAVKFALANSSDLVNSLALRSEEQARQDFISTIVEKSGGDAQSKKHLRESLSAKFKVGPQYADSAIANVDKFSTAALRDKAEEAETRAKLKTKSPEELRRIVANATARPSLPPLPPELTAQVLKKAAASEVRRLIRMHGLENFNARLQGRN